MKTLVTILFAGVLSTTSVLAGVIPSEHRKTERPAPQLPWRLYEKRPLGAQRAKDRAASAANIGTPQLPMRLYRKQPLGAQRKPGNVKVASRIQ
jgi:hypothetical protein